MEEKEEFEEVDWEGEDIKWEEESVNDDSNDSQPLKIVLSMNNPQENRKSPQSRKKRKIVARYTEKDYERALSRRKDNFMWILRKIQDVVNWSNEMELLCVVQSLLPAPLLHALTTRSVLNLNDIIEINQWLYEEFKVISSNDVTEEEGRDGSNSDDMMMTVIPKKATSVNQFTQLFYILLTSFNIRSRMICAIDPLSLSPQHYEDLGDEETVKVKLTRLKPLKLSPQMYFWVEIFVKPMHDQLIVINRNTKDVSDNTKWIHFDCIQRIHSQEELVETKIRKNKEVEFVIACEYIQESFLFSDLSMKYKVLKNKSEKLRLAVYDTNFREWLERKLIELSSFSAKIEEVAQNSSFVDLTDDALDPNYVLQEQLLEKAQLTKIRSVNQQTLPTTFAAFQNHPYYCLERHLKADEVLNPSTKKIIAMFKGEAVYLQEHKETLKSKLEWKKEMRQVKENEQPLKVVKRNVRIEDSSSNGSHNEVKEKALYAKYQTENLKIRPVIDGVLPINEYGNIEVWDGLPQYVPHGAVYVEGGGIIKLAKALGIQYAPAVTDFEMKNGKYYPKITGIVILTEHKQLVEDGMYEFSAINDEKEYELYQKKILDRWKKLVHSLQTWQRLKEQYGP